MKPRLLITGIGGFVGRHLSKLLDREDIEIFGIHLSSEKDLSYLPDRVELIIADLTDFDNLIRKIKSIMPSYIVHLAAAKRTDILYSQIQVDVIGLNNLLTAIAGSEIRLIVTGSSAEYGFVDSKLIPITEMTPINPTSDYGIAKVAASTLALSTSRFKNIDLSVVRPFNITGPGEPNFLVASYFAKILKEYNEGIREGLVVGNLDSIRDFTDVRDVVKAIWSILLEGKSGEIYNICSGVPTRIKEIWDRMATISGNKGINPKQRINEDEIKINQVGNNTKLYNSTGWKPIYSLEDSLNEVWNEKDTNSNR